MCVYTYIYIYIYIYIRTRTQTVELCCNVLKWTEYFASLSTIVVLTEVYYFVVNSEELTGATEYLTL
jgi:hypothetical protein